MRVFLAAFPLQGRSVAVVGGGDMAEAKLRLVSRTPATLLWFDPEGAASSEPVPGLSAQRREPDHDDFSGVRLAFIALGDDAAAARIADRARAAGALVNVVDRPHLSDFQTPALIDRGEVVVGVATGGSAPILARDVRARVEAVLPQGLDLLGRLAREIRATVKSSIPDFMARRRFWERGFRGPAADLAARGDEAGARRALLRALNTDAPSEGHVQLVGAGPGDPDHLTLKALRALQDADVVVHDRLVSDAVLDMARRDARRIAVGKRRADHSVAQDDIARILVDEARAGHRVVRLKGGDPFVFGRGGEEIEALRAAGVPFTVVPGLTAALACAAAAELPLTHRDHAQAVTLLTGQGKAGATVDWASLSAPGHTTAVYMGVDRAQAIADCLLAAGRAAETPVAVVENGGSAGERVIKGRLADLGRLVHDAAVAGPAILFIGETAALARESGGLVQAAATASEAAA